MLDSSSTGKIYVPIDQSYCEHARAMGKYNADDAYKSKSDLFNRYFFNYQQSRLEYYYIFLKKHLNKEEDILSVASGRCINELYLMEEGYKITCSDIEIPDAYKETKALFPDFEYIKYNVLSGPTCQKYNGIICLSLIYLFDEKQLNRFFRNVSESLTIGGHLVLDSAGSPNNLLSYIIHDIILKYEMMLMRIVKLISERKWYGFITKDNGYRRTDKEIIGAARQAGLELTDKENYAFLTEFRRSYLLNRAIKHCSICKRVFSIIGKNIPYIRMFNFKKIA